MWEEVGGILPANPKRVGGTWAVHPRNLGCVEGRGPPSLGMKDWRKADRQMASEYRIQFYEKYVSRQVRPGGAEPTTADYVLWAQVRRGAPRLADLRPFRPGLGKGLRDREYARSHANVHIEMAEHDNFQKTLLTLISENGKFRLGY